MEKTVEFYLGSKTKRGFWSLFGQLTDEGGGLEHVYLLKGGPGCGKSTLMKKLGRELEAQGRRIVRIPCASDPGSLDAILDLDGKRAIVDATAPHALEATLPGAGQSLVDLGQFWDQEALKNRRGEIEEADRAVAHRHSQAAALIAAAEGLLAENRRRAAERLDRKKLEREAERILAQLPEAGAGRTAAAMLSAVSVGATVFLGETIRSLCSRVYAVEDPWGAGSDWLFRRILEESERRGLAAVCCYCGVSGEEKIDHVLFPEAGIGLSQRNPWHWIRHPDVQVLDRGWDGDEPEMEELGEAAGQLIKQAETALAQAKREHDRLEAIYKSAMDFTGVDRLEEALRRQWG